MKVISLTPLFAFVSPGAARPGTPARGLLHDSPLDTRVQGPCPLTPKPPRTSVSTDTFHSILLVAPVLTECVGSQRHRRPLVSAEGANRQGCAPPVDLPPLDSKADEGGMHTR